MKAISIREPWAGLIANGKKTIETRTWATSFRGDVLICASAKPESTNSGKAIAIARIADCRPMTIGDETAACLPLYSGAWAWTLENIRPIEPFSVKGRLGFYHVAMPQEFSRPARGPRPDQHTENLPSVD